MNARAELAPQGWMGPDMTPQHPGLYERQSALGISVDVWDGKVWRRRSAIANVDRRGGVGVICANQALAWRTPA